MFISGAEALCVLCRKLGWETAESKLHNLRQSNYVSVADTERMSRIAAQIKCERGLAIGDAEILRRTYPPIQRKQPTEHPRLLRMINIIFEISQRNRVKAL